MQHAESAASLAPQLAVLACWSGLAWRLAALRTRDEIGTRSGRAAQGPKGGWEAAVQWRAAARLTVALLTVALLTVALLTAALLAALTLLTAALLTVAAGPTSPTDVSRRSTRPGGGAGMLPMYLPPRRRRTSRRLRCWPTTWACSLCSASPRACPKQRTPSPRPPEVLADAPGEASPPLHVTPPPVGRGIVNESAVGWISLPVPLLIAIGAHTLRTQLCPSLKLPQSATRLPLTRTAPRARAPHRGRGRGRGDVRTALLR